MGEKQTWRLAIQAALRGAIMRIEFLFMAAFQSTIALMVIGLPSKIFLPIRIFGRNLCQFSAFGVLAEQLGPERVGESTSA
jgi:hypothetical protein